MVRSGRIKKNRAERNDVTTHKAAIQPGDVQKMYESGTLSDDKPQALQNKVFFEIMLHFGKRAKEGLHDLIIDSFQFRSDDDKNVYAIIPYNEKSKTNHGLESGREEKEQRMYKTGEKGSCPVGSLRKYLSKLNPKSNYFFQHISSKKSALTEQYWYNGKRMGVNAIGGLMKHISKDSELSRIYTNHCIRATSVTVLSSEGHEANDIIVISGHKNPSSLIQYTLKVGDEKRRKMSKSLTAYIKGEKKSIPDSTVSVPPERSPETEDKSTVLVPTAQISTVNPPVSVATAQTSTVSAHSSVSVSPPQTSTKSVDPSALGKISSLDMVHNVPQSHSETVFQ